MEKEDKIAFLRPSRGREIKTNDITGQKVGMMRVVAQRYLSNPVNKGKPVKQEDLIKAFNNLPNPPREDDTAYHEVFKPNQKFLVPDNTLLEMEKIVNSRIRPKRSFRFKDETMVDIPDRVDAMPDRLDDVLEKIDDFEFSEALSDEIEIPKEVKEEPEPEEEEVPEEVPEEEVPEEVPEEEVPEEVPEEVKPEPNLIDEYIQLTPRTSSTILSPITSREDTQPLVEPPLILPFKVADLEKDGLSKFFDVSHLTSDDIKNKKLHFRILGNYCDTDSPKFKIQKFDGDSVYEIARNNNQTNGNNLYKVKSKRPGNKPRLTISGKLYKKPSVGFLKTFNDSSQGEPVDTFSIVNKVHNSANTASQCALSIAGKFMSETKNKSILPVLSIQVNKRGSIARKTVRKQFQLSNKKF